MDKDKFNVSGLIPFSGHCMTNKCSIKLSNMELTSKYKTDDRNLYFRFVTEEAYSITSLFFFEQRSQE